MLGIHQIAELHGCPAERLDSPELVEQQLLIAATSAGATVVSSCFHHFSPHGVSGAVIIAESHITLHTWPEFKYAAVDVFTCGDAGMTQAITQAIAAALGASRTDSKILQRGVFASPPIPAEQALASQDRV